MEGMRDDPREEIVPVEPIVQAHIFGQNECILPGSESMENYNQETDCYSNQSTISVDETVSKMQLCERISCFSAFAEHCSIGRAVG